MSLLNIAAGPPEPPADTAQPSQSSGSGMDVDDWQLTGDEWEAISQEVAALGY